MPKNMTLRLNDEQAAEVEVVGRIEGQTLAEVVRSAIDAHIAERRADPAFRERLAQRQKEEAALYRRLAR